ncbi:MAG: HEPN domain-containing protein [Chloroflexota bacterium]
MSSPQPTREVRAWTRQSEHDLRDAEILAQSGRHATASFMCHQAAEKILVAFLMQQGAERVWGHSLADLCEDAMPFDATFDLVKSMAGMLDKHYLGARYPSTLPGGVPAETYDAEDSRRALEIASEVRRFVLEKVQAA